MNGDFLDMVSAARAVFDAHEKDGDEVVVMTPFEFRSVKATVEIAAAAYADSNDIANLAIRLLGVYLDLLDEGFAPYDGEIIGMASETDLSDYYDNFHDIVLRARYGESLEDDVVDVFEWNPPLEYEDEDALEYWAEKSESVRYADGKLTFDGREVEPGYALVRTFDDDVLLVKQL